MPEALSTTKRKFYKFLDSISPPAPTNPADATTKDTASKRWSLLSTRSSIQQQQQQQQQIEPATKRLRPETSAATIAAIKARINDPLRPKSLVSLNGRPSTSSSSIRQITGRASRESLTSSSSGQAAGSGRAATAPVREPPTFCPWDHDAFLARLATFAPVTEWMPKPDEAVGEVPWAKRGWHCVAYETIGCVSCRARVKVDFSPPQRRVEGGGEVAGSTEGPDADQVEEEDENERFLFEEAFERGLVDKYKALIVEGHHESCLWRKSGCKDDIYRMPVVRTAWWQNHVRESISSLLDTRDDVNLLQIRQIDALPDATKIARDLPAKFLTRDKTQESPADGSMPPPDLVTKMLTIALTGWHGSSDAGTSLLVCNACFQRLGLWMYTAPDAPTQADAHTLAASDPRLSTVTSSLDLIEQHREHCPFRSAASQSATGDFVDQPAWRILWTTVARFADEQRRRSRHRYSSASSVLPDHAASMGEAQDVAPKSSGQPTATTEAAEASAADVNGALTMAGEERYTGGGYEARMETARLDRERTHKLRRLKRALGIKVRVPVVVTRREREQAAAAAAAAAVTEGVAETQVVESTSSAVRLDEIATNGGPALEASTSATEAEPVIDVGDDAGASTHNNKGSAGDKSQGTDGDLQGANVEPE